MARLRDEAEALADAMELGMCTIAEAIAWSDAQILRAEVPDVALCDVSLARDLYPQDLARMLREIPGNPDQSIVNDLLMLLINEQLRTGCGSPDAVAEALHQLALADEIEDPKLREIAWWSTDLLDLAAEGMIAESRQQIADLMAIELARVTASAVSSWSFPVVLGSAPR